MCTCREIVGTSRILPDTKNYDDNDQNSKSNSNRCVCRIDGLMIWDSACSNQGAFVYCTLKDFKVIVVRSFSLRFSAES